MSKRHKLSGAQGKKKRKEEEEKRSKDWGMYSKDDAMMIMFPVTQGILIENGKLLAHHIANQ